MLDKYIACVHIGKKGGIMELRVLKYFLAVVKEGTIIRAAHFLHVTQPTLSRQLIELEKELGQQLFIRSSHSIKLTPAGILFHQHAQEIIELAEKTKTIFSDSSKDIAGEIYIGGGETSFIKKIAEIIKEIQNEYPNITYNLYSGNADDVTEKLDRGLLDFGLLIQPTDISKYEYLPLKSYDTFGLIMRKDSKLAEKDFITAEDLQNIPLIAPRQAKRLIGNKNEYYEWVARDASKLNIVARYNLIYNAAIMVTEGVGYALGLNGLIDVTGNNNLCFKPLNPTLKLELDIVWKRYRLFSPAANIFLAKIRQKFAN